MTATFTVQATWDESKTWLTEQQLLAGIRETFELDWGYKQLGVTLQVTHDTGESQ